MSNRSFPRLSSRWFALRAAWKRQVPVRVAVASPMPNPVVTVPVVDGRPSGPSTAEGEAVLPGPGLSRGLAA